MKQIEILAVLEALAKIVLTRLDSNASSYKTQNVYSLFMRYNSIRDTLRNEYSSLFSGLPQIEPANMMGAIAGQIARNDLDILRQEIGYCHQILSIILADHIDVKHQNSYVNLERIKELESISKDKFDLKKLIEFCKGLNKCYSLKIYLAIPLLVRSILDHVPPIFDKETFSEVANNYKFTKSIRELILNLDNSSRKIADSYLHTHISNKEVLPNITQVDFRNNLDILLQEIVRILKD